VDLDTFSSESAINRRAYEALREQVRREYAGSYVALAHGKIVGAARTFDGARSLVERLVPVPEYYLVFPAEADPDFGLVYDLSRSV
jgi:hypothetical protein